MRPGSRRVWHAVFFVTSRFQEERNKQGTSDNRRSVPRMGLGQIVRDCIHDNGVSVSPMDSPSVCGCKLNYMLQSATTIGLPRCEKSGTTVL